MRFVAESEEEVAGGEENHTGEHHEDDDEHARDAEIAKLSPCQVEASFPLASAPDIRHNYRAGRYFETTWRTGLLPRVGCPTMEGS